MIKIIKISFCVFIAVIALVSCRTFFEGDKIRFRSETCKSHTVPRETVDSVNFRTFGY